MFTVKDYLTLLKTEADGVGDDYVIGNMNAGALAVILSLNPKLTYQQLKNLPNPVVWSLFNKSVTEKEYAEDMMKSAVDFVEAFDTAKLSEGVKTMMSGKPFLIHIVSGESEFGLGQVTGKPDLRKNLMEIEEEEWGYIRKSKNFSHLLSCIKTLNGEIVTTIGAYETLTALPYLEYMKLTEIQIRLQDKLFTMDWKEMLKN